MVVYFNSIHIQYLLKTTMNETTEQLVNDIDTSCVLSFLAENINLYNWHLLREENPRCVIYDETNNTTGKMYYVLLSRANLHNGFCIQLQNTILKLKLSVQPEDNPTSSYLLTNYIQNRQRNLYYNYKYPYIETVLWEEVKYTNPPVLYIKLNILEDIYTTIILYNDEIQKVCYNKYNDTDQSTDRVFEPPWFGFQLEDLKLEEIYLTNNLPDDIYVEIFPNPDDADDADDDEPSTINADENVMNVLDTLYIINTISIIDEFDCPICFENQPSLPKSKCIFTTCGHQYCVPCFQCMVQYKAVCAMCREEIKEYNIISNL